MFDRHQAGERDARAGAAQPLGGAEAGRISLSTQPGRADSAHTFFSRRKIKFFFPSLRQAGRGP